MPEDETTESEVERLLAALGIALPAESRATVATHVRILRQHAAAVTAFPTDDEIEPAPIFRA